MRKAGVSKEKGDLGEEAAIQALKEYVKYNGGVILQSVKYPYATDTHGNQIAGNLIHQDGHISPVPYSSLPDEVDIVLITERRIFLIEAKSYGNATIKLTNDWSYRNSSKMDKCVVAQTEKHARHFYNTFWEYIPNGDPSYIIPVLVFVDKSKLVNEMTTNDCYVTILNELNKTIGNLDKYSTYRIDTKRILDKISSKATFTRRV